MNTFSQFKWKPNILKATPELSRVKVSSRVLLKHGYRVWESFSLAVSDFKNSSFWVARCDSLLTSSHFRDLSICQINWYSYHLFFILTFSSAINLLFSLLRQILTEYSSLILDLFSSYLSLRGNLVHSFIYLLQKPIIQF